MRHLWPQPHSSLNSLTSLQLSDRPVGWAHTQTHNPMKTLPPPLPLETAAGVVPAMKCLECAVHLCITKGKNCRLFMLHLTSILAVITYNGSIIVTVVQ